MACLSFYSNKEEDMLQLSLSSGNHEFDCDATFYDIPFFNSSGYNYYQEGLLRAIVPWPSMEEEDDAAEGKESNWLWQCDSIFAWQHEYGALVDDGIISDDLEETDCLYPIEDQNNGHFSFQDEDSAESYSYDVWSFCDSLLGYGGGENDHSNGGRDESGIAYKPSLREFAVYEDIFGYWPCLYTSECKT